jgi:Superfamily II helicase and inactivated derivatives
MSPYEYLYSIKNPLEKQKAVVSLEQYAVSVGVSKKDYRAFWKAYQAQMHSSIVASENGVTEFANQSMELDTGEWRADESGVWRNGDRGTIDVACSHPIMPIQRIHNIDTSAVKVILLYRRGQQKQAWHNLMVSLGTITNAKTILSLADNGVSVTSGKRSQNLVDYLTEVMDRNYDRIPERLGVSRLGWSREGFIPYTENLIYDGGANYQQAFDSVYHSEGTMDEWLYEARDMRTYSLTGRIVLAASFASVLVEPLGILPFFVHLWSMSSGTGKSVAQMLAAAVWGDPDIGGAFFPTFKSTGVSMELKAGFLNSLPLFLDELQLAKDRRGNVIFNVYELAAGTGKSRATKELGLAQTPTWRNCFITSGESPIVSESDGAGAVNRVIEIECGAGNQVIKDGRRTANAVRVNYGHAGRVFVKHLEQEGNIEYMKALYDTNYRRCLATDTTEKQAMAAAAIITADMLATEWIFEDENSLTIEEISEFLKTQASVSASERGYEFMCDWVSQHANKLVGYSEETDVYGSLGDGSEEGWVYIIRSVWNKVCGENGYSAKALLSHLKSKGLLRTKAGSRAYTKGKRINRVITECVVMKLKQNDEE